MIRQFFDAAEAGDQDLLEVLLSDNSEFLSDGGGIVPAAPILTTKSDIVKFFLSLKRSPIFNKDYRIETKWINSRPGMTISKLVNENHWQVETVMSFEIEKQTIVRIFAQRNPEKLKAIETLIRKNSADYRE